MTRLLPTIVAFMLLVGSAGAQHCRITVEGDGSTGSGTLVRKTEKLGTIITCAHLFSSSREGIVVSIAGRFSRATLVRIDKANDLAVLSIVAPPCDPFPLGPDPKGELTAGGFGPDNQLRFIRGRIAGYTSPPNASTVIKGMVRPGDSGGGVFDDQSRLVGVVWGCRPDDGDTYVTTGEPVRAILSGVNEMACYGGQCFQGNCYGGQCGPPVIARPFNQGQVALPPQPPTTRPNNPPIQPPPPTVTPPIVGQQGPAGPPGPKGDKGDAGAPGKDANCECGPKWEALGERLTKIEADITAIKNQKPPAPPAIPNTEQHVVVIADHNAPYWQKLAEEMQKTEKTYKGVREAPMPDFPIGIHPQLVVYENGVPIRIVKGLYEVQNVLARLSRGDAI